MFRQFLQRLLETVRGSRRSGTDAGAVATVHPEARHEAAAPRGGSRSPLVLAYVGDAVYELYVRVHLVEDARLVRNFQPAATALVRASTQSRILGVLEPALTEEERNVVRLGRNANIGQIPKSASMIDYRRATALECLLGYLLLEGREERLLELLRQAIAAGGEPSER